MEKPGEGAAMADEQRVFISYASEDFELATAYRDALEAASVRCWMAPRDIPAGMNYAEALTDAIDVCSVFLIVFSVCST
jgi:hypothetical protein